MSLRPEQRRLALGLAVAALALALALWGVPLAEVGAAISSARWPGLLAVAAIFLGQQGLRALRQKLILDAAAAPLPYREHLSVLCVGFLAINTLPGRIGEVVRPLLLLERHGLPMGAGFALVFVERSVDLFATLCMIAAAATLLPPPPGLLDLAPGSAEAIQTARRVAWLALPALAIGFATVLLGGRRLLDRVLPLLDRGPARWRSLLLRLTGFAHNFLDGLQGLRRPALLVQVLGLTAFTWVASIWMFPLAAWSFGFGSLVGYAEGVGLLAVSMLGGVIPGAPGAVGTYEAALRGGLMLYGISGPQPVPEGASSMDAAAVAFALTLHWWVYLVQASTAIWFLVVDRIDPRALVRRAREALRAPALPAP